MSLAHRRRKQPDTVRQQLLEVAARLSHTFGIGGVTLDAVAQAAGVSKGGLLHHFPSKLALLDGLFDDLVGRFDQAIAEEMRDDPVFHGRFTRAYLTVTFAMNGDGLQDWQALTIGLLAEPHLRARWRQWVEEKALEFAATDSSPACLMARLTADGLWLSDLLESHEIDGPTRQAMLVHLKALLMS